MRASFGRAACYKRDNLNEERTNQTTQEDTRFHPKNLSNKEREKMGT
jgi:hypothetical protein